MKPSQSLSPSEAVKCALIHDISNDLSVIVGDCDLLQSEQLTQSAWERIRQIRTTAMKIAKKIATNPCPLSENAPELVSSRKTPVKKQESP